MLRLVLIIPLLLTLLGCDRTPAAPAPSGPRLVVLSPALAIILRDLHADAPIVGRHAWDMVLDKSIPACGDQAGIDYEALLTARPTHILLEWGQRELPQRLTSLAAKHHWQVSNYTLLSLDEIRETTHRLYDEFIYHKPLMAAVTAPPWERSPLALEMARAWSPREGDAGNAIAAAGRILILETVNPAHALGPGSFHHQIIRAIGGHPIPDAGSPYIEMDAEDVLHLAPDAIILIEPRNPDSPIRDDPLTWEELSTKLGPLARLDIPAVKNRRIAVIDDPLALTPSTAMIRLADDFARLLESWGAAPKPGQ
ncbi:MAG: ABC transporter substrate-binding protein [Phycisphaerales bacterium]|nr:ABC transporter substrate-binding protein [Phycisphaerales bacterium]